MTVVPSTDGPVHDTLSRLRSAAKAARTWPEMTLERVGAPPDGPEIRLVDSVPTGLVLPPGADTHLRARLDLPETIATVPTAGDTLEVTVSSLFPIQIAVDDHPVFGEHRLPVAPGPALIEVIPSLRPGSNGTLEVHVQTPDNQITQWVKLQFSTPRLRRRFEAIDVAWAQLAMADAVAHNAGDRRLLLQAARCVPDAVAELADSELQPCLARLADALTPLNDRCAETFVHVVGHSHIDLSWLWTWSDTCEVILRDFASVVGIMRDYPEMTFSHSQPASYEVVRDRDPRLFADVLSLIAEGRWEATTMQWVEGDTNLASSEATARQLLEGVRYTRDVLGVTPDVLHCPDTFGHPGNLPQLASASGARFFYHHRGNPGGHDMWPAYWWEGDDGSRLLALSTSIYHGEITAGELAVAAIAARRRGLPCNLHFHGVGDHGGGPARRDLDALRRLQETPGLPRAACSTISACGRQLLESGVALPVHKGESSTIFEGCYTTHADSKRYNRHGENLLTTAETLSALAGRDERAVLQPAWRDLLFHQFHDIIDGSAIHEVYEKNADDYAAVERSASSVIERALDVLEAGVEGDVIVTNQLGVERREAVTWSAAPGHEKIVQLVSESGELVCAQRTADGGLCFVAAVPPFGSVGFMLPGSPPRVDGDGTSDSIQVAEGDVYIDIQTTLYDITVHRPSGSFVSFVDRRTGRQLVAYGTRRQSDYMDTARFDLGLNVVQLQEEYLHGMSSWHLDDVWRETSFTRDATTSVVEAGPVRVVIDVDRTVLRSTVKQRIVLYATLPRIDVDLQVEWRDPADLDHGIPNLKVAFTSRLPEVEAWFETPFGAVRRSCDGQEVPALRWADVGGDEYGVAVLNDCKYGYDALGSRLRLSILRCAFDPDAVTDVGAHAVRYAFLPHPGSWRAAGVVKAAAALNQPLLVRSSSTPRVSTPNVTWRPRLDDSTSVALSILKTAADGCGTVVRLYESTGREVQAVLHGLPVGAVVTETSPVEENIAPVPNRVGGLPLRFKPWQVRSFRVEN